MSQTVGLYIPPELLSMDLSRPELLIASEIRQFGRCHARNRHFQERFKLSKSTVVTALKKLSEKGILHEEGDEKTVLINIPNGTEITPNGTNLTRTEITPGRPILTPDRPKKIPEGVKSTRPSKQELNKNLTRTNKKSSAELLGEDMPDFVEFYSAYPKKKSRTDAAKAWRKLQPSSELARQIIADVKARAKSHDWTKDNRQFCPFPASYLNGMKWLDEKPEAAQPDAFSNVGDADNWEKFYNA